MFNSCFLVKGKNKEHGLDTTIKAIDDVLINLVGMWTHEEPEECADTHHQQHLYLDASCRVEFQWHRKSDLTNSLQVATSFPTTVTSLSLV